MVPFATMHVALINRLRPRAVTNGPLTELMKALAEYFGQAQRQWTLAFLASIFSAGDAHGGNAAGIPPVAGNFEPFAVRTRGR